MLKIKATDKELTQAYHRLSLIYHPDKHQNSENKRDAELIFAKLKTAYEGLIDNNAFILPFLSNISMVFSLNKY